MRRYWVVALAVLTLLGVLSPPAFAQAPAPKVSITGFIASYGQAAHNNTAPPGTLAPQAAAWSLNSITDPFSATKMFLASTPDSIANRAWAFKKR